jgi:hypothetical protein
VRAMTRLAAYAPILVLAASIAHADPYSDTIELFKNAGASAAFFSKSHGYAVFPTVGTTGATSAASGGKKDATTASAGYEKGMAVFTIAKGGLMYTATVAGQKFSYKPR